MKTAFLFTAIIFTTIKFMQPDRKNFSANQNPKGFAVIELFTSEGCSSCPPADEAMIDISNEYKKGVFIIGFHVDYWNSLGWKDAFSSASYTERQKQYAGVLGLNSIYTPQVIVNGRNEFVGSDKKRLHDAVSMELNKPATSAISISAKSSADNKVNISYSIKPDNNYVLNFVLVQLSTQTDVKRGENSGRQLHHINLARDFKTINGDNDHGNISLTIPNGLIAKDCQVIGYLQDKKNLEIKGAAELRIE